jgi:transposase-like protein
MVARACSPPCPPLIPTFLFSVAHKIRNVLAKVRKADQAEVKADLHRITNAATLPQARTVARRFADRWESIYPKAVACLRADLDDLLTCFRYPTLEERKAVRTTDEIDKRFVAAGAMISAHGRPRGEERGGGCEPRRAA